jgi:hypothetical protein
MIAGTDIKKLAGINSLIYNCSLFQIDVEILLPAFKHTDKLVKNQVIYQ